MAAFNKYEVFVENLAEKVHNLGADTLRILLSNAAPNAAAHAVKADAVEIAAGNGYPAGGNSLAVTASVETGGVYSLSQTADVTFVAAGGSIGPFRYAILYNSTAAGGPLIGWWDYGSSITLANGETFVVDLGGTVLTIT